MTALEWYEVWADDGAEAPPSLLLLIKYTDSDVLRIHSPKIDEPLYETSELSDAVDWLESDEYVKVRGRVNLLDFSNE